MIKIVAIPAFNDNYIWCLYDSTTLQALVVDPGDALPVVEFIEANDLVLSAILITHHHLDHTGGIEALNKHYSPTVFGPANDQIAGIDNRLVDGDSIELFGIVFSVLAIPGHTLDHIAYFSQSSQNTSLNTNINIDQVNGEVELNSIDTPILFCGDTLFAGGCGRIFEGNPTMMKDSLDKLTELPGSTQVFCAHEYTLANLAFAMAVEPNNKTLQQRVKIDQRKRAEQLPTLPTTIKAEKATNPFLRYQEAEIISSATRHKQSPLTEDVSVFATLREWKNNF